MSTKLTGKQVEGDVYRLLKDSALASALTGGVYRAGNRPRDSRLEDAVVMFTTGLHDEVQTGIVTINIYVPDIDPYGNGVFVEDGARCEAVERLAQQWVDSLTAGRSNYLFRLQRTIYTEEEPQTRQHFVVVHLNFSFYD